ncbi:hypothetical protein GKC30_07940 [Pseudodesulfovibrio sp. F-1]|uniref:Uncharacterized protein n=1 Tax=Pseudodesulfovibrio alkaliphilus TaxID=2661613 RepID=A0A7K1KNB3_9BACT|nr:hypothetical protein [Pseudodesulfovibrio alkaliphilus]MUM77559.1 hypothetical protein [Pseudodesulfovibrio alkaliphilus]
MKVRLAMAPTPLNVVVRLGRTWPRTLLRGTGAVSCVWSRKLRIRPRRLRLMDPAPGREAPPARGIGGNNGRSVHA